MAVGVEEYLLTKLSEEGGEVVQTCGKTIVFGKDERNYRGPEDGPTNADRLVSEVNDLVGTMDLLTVLGVVPVGWLSSSDRAARVKRLVAHMAYSYREGRILPEEGILVESLCQSILRETVLEAAMRVLEGRTRDNE